MSKQSTTRRIPVYHMPATVLHHPAHKPELTDPREYFDPREQAVRDPHPPLRLHLAESEQPTEKEKEAAWVAQQAERALALMEMPDEESRERLRRQFRQDEQAEMDRLDLVEAAQRLVARFGYDRVRFYVDLAGSAVREGRS